jgi:hypothetical protein
VGREVDLKEKKRNQSRKDWEKKVMDWARAGRKDHERMGIYYSHIIRREVGTGGPSARTHLLVSSITIVYWWKTYTRYNGT